MQIAVLLSLTCQSLLLAVPMGTPQSLWGIFPFTAQVDIECSCKFNDVKYDNQTEES